MVAHRGNEQQEGHVLENGQTRQDRTGIYAETLRNGIER